MSALTPAGMRGDRVSGSAFTPYLLFQEPPSGWVGCLRLLSLSTDPKTSLPTRHHRALFTFPSNHLPPDHSGNPGGRVLSLLHPSSGRTECL